MVYCDNCGRIGGYRRTFPPPKEGEKTLELVFCSEECEQAKRGKLEQEARLARTVN